MSINESTNPLSRKPKHGSTTQPGGTSTGPQSRSSSSILADSEATAVQDSPETVLGKAIALNEYLNGQIVGNGNIRRQNHQMCVGLMGSTDLPALESLLTALSKENMAVQIFNLRGGY